MAITGLYFCCIYIIDPSPVTGSLWSYGSYALCFVRVIDEWELNRTLSWSQSLGSFVSLSMGFLCCFLSHWSHTGAADGSTGKGSTGSRKQNSLEMLTHNVGRH